MAAVEMKNRNNIDKNVLSGVLRSLIMNPLSDLKNAKFRIQHGGRQNEKKR